MKNKGVKLLITGLESIGKTTLTSGIKDAMVAVVDDKQYPYSIPHYNVNDYNGIDAFKEELVTKLKAYKEKYGKAPKTVVLDTVTKLYEKIYLFANANYKGFDVHNCISQETLAVNIMLESLLIDNGVNVVIVAHVQYDENTSRYVVPATGQFKNSGSWLSVVDEATYMFVKNNTRWVAHSTLKYPCRSTLDMKPEEPLEEYDINDHISELVKRASERTETVL